MEPTSRNPKTDNNGSPVIELLPTQVDALSRLMNGMHDVVIYQGGLGSGKTRALACAAIALSQRWPGSVGLVSSCVYPQLRDSLVPLIGEIAEEAGVTCRVNWHANRIDMANGSTMLLRSGEVGERVRSLNADWGCIDEAGLYRKEDFWETLHRIRTGRCGGRSPVLIATNPSAWFAEAARVLIASGVAVRLIASTAENSYLPREYVSSLISTSGGVDSPLVQRIVYGRDVRFGGMVYPAFDRALHVMDDLRAPDGWDIFGALDFGYNHAFCYLLFAQSGEDVYVLDEHYSAGKLLREHAADIRAVEARHGVADHRRVNRYADHDTQDREELAAYGIDSLPADKRDVVAGIYTVTRLLTAKEGRRPHLLISGRCRNLIREIESYEWDRGARDDRPVKGRSLDPDSGEGYSDDAVDALRYGLHTRMRGSDIRIDGKWVS